LFRSQERFEIAAGVKDAGDQHAVLLDQVADDRGSLERNGTKAGQEVVTWAASAGDIADLAASRIDAVHIAPSS
jgi:hypothetical protein